MATFRSTDGLELFYERWPQDSALPPVVLHHGFIANHDVDWVATGVVRALLDAGRDVVAIDARGHGRSEKVYDPDRYGEPRMAEDVSTLLDVLDLSVVDLAGYSMGAIVALLTAARDKRVRRLVIGGVGAAVVELGGVDRRLARPGALREALLVDDPSTITDPGVIGFRAFADSIGADRRAMAAQAAAVHASPIALDEVRIPTLLVTGRDDPLAARPQALSEALPDADHRFVGGDHGGALQDPQFAAQLVEFLGRP